MAVDGPRYYYLGPWVWDTDFFPVGGWVPPANTVGLVDLRPLTMGLTYGFFSTNVPIGDSSYIYLGDDLNGALTQVQRDAWQGALGTGPVPAGSVLDTLWWALGEASDPEQITRAAPIIPCHTGIKELHLGGHSLVRSATFRGKDDPAWPQVQKVIQDNYRGIRQHVLDLPAAAVSRMPQAAQNSLAKLHRKYLECIRRKLRLSVSDAGLLIPGDLPQEAPEPPTTSYSEDFSGTLSAWTQVDGTFAASGGVLTNSGSGSAFPSSIRYESDLSTDDHSAQLLVNTPTDTSGFYSAAVRFSGSAETFYHAVVRSSGSVANIAKIVAGTSTLLQSGSWTPSFPHTQKMQVDGSSLSVFSGVTSLNTTTDTSITGNLRAGLSCHNTASFNGTADDWYAEDLVGGSTLTQSTAWKIFNTSSQATAYKIKTAANQNTAWAIKNAASADTSWLISAALSQATGWKISNSASVDTAWKTYATASRDTAWKILNAGSASVDVAWKIYNSANQATAWSIKTQAQVDTAWKILNAGSTAVNVAWRIYNTANQNTAWKIFDSAQQATGWRVFNASTADSAWLIKAALSQDTGWRLYNSADIATAWAINSELIPDPVKTFLAPERDVLFHAPTRTLIFLAPKK